MELVGSWFEMASKKYFHAMGAHNGWLIGGLGVMRLTECSSQHKKRIFHSAKKPESILFQSQTVAVLGAMR